MTFLGIGPGEFFLILIILLVVVGPERLPGFARQAGKMIISLRNWVQRSPDAMMLLRARDELELELRTIRDDLTQEMQTVRDEMMSVREEVMQAAREATVDATRQINDATRQIDTTAQLPEAPTSEQSNSVAQALLGSEELPTADFANEPWYSVSETIPADSPAPEPPADDDQVLDFSTRTIAPPPAESAPASPPMAVPRSSKPNAIVATQPVPVADDHVRSELETVKQQLQSMTAELRLLQEQFQHIRDGMRAAERTEAPSAAAPQPQEVS